MFVQLIIGLWVIVIVCMSMCWWIQLLKIMIYIYCYTVITVSSHVGIGDSFKVVDIVNIVVVGVNIVRVEIGEWRRHRCHWLYYHWLSCCDSCGRRFIWLVFGGAGGDMLSLHLFRFVECFCGNVCNIWLLTEELYSAHHRAVMCMCKCCVLLVR